MAAFFVLLTMTVNAPQAAAAGWPAPLGDTDNNALFTQPNGRVTVGGCGRGAYEQRTFGALGDQVAALKQTSAEEYYTCDYWSGIAPDGTVYTVKANNSKYEIVAVRGGQALGKPVRVSNLCSSSDTGHPIGLRYTAHGVFALIEHDRWQNCTSKYLLVRINTSTGAVAGRLAIQNSYVYMDDLEVTRNYLVVEGDQTIDYVPYNLSANGVKSVTFEPRRFTAAHVATTFDAMSYVAHEVKTPNASCKSSVQQYEKVAAYNEHNQRPIWSYKLPACTYNVQVYAAPFDIAILSYYILLPDGARQYEVLALSTDGTQMWQPRVLSNKTLKGNFYTSDTTPLLYVDNNGNIVARRTYLYAPGNYRATAFQFFSLFSGELTDE